MSGDAGWYPRLHSVDWLVRVGGSWAFVRLDLVREEVAPYPPRRPPGCGQEIFALLGKTVRPWTYSAGTRGGSASLAGLVHCEWLEVMVGAAGVVGCAAGPGWVPVRGSLGIPDPVF